MTDLPDGFNPKRIDPKDILIQKRGNTMGAIKKLSTNEPKKTRKITLFKEVYSFGVGQSFGELALMNSKAR
jgi:hypothetical protein